MFTEPLLKFKLIFAMFSRDIRTVRVLNFVGKIFMFLVGKKIHGALIFMAMAAW